MNALSPAVEARRRRTFAIISHPDAGKSTLTEALALHAHVINEAGAVHGKAGRKATVSDWMEMEQARGISVSSTALQFEYLPQGSKGAEGDGQPYVINLVDTPGHSDFSEDTYRTLTAVDSAVMVIDAAKGIEARTRKLFEVCRLRDIPIITFINKLDREAQDPMALLDEIASRLQLDPAPIWWPAESGNRLRGMVEMGTGRFQPYARKAAGVAEDTPHPEALPLADAARFSTARRSPLRTTRVRKGAPAVSWADGLGVVIATSSAVDRGGRLPFAALRNHRAYWRSSRRTGCGVRPGVARQGLMSSPPRRV